MNRIVAALAAAALAACATPAGPPPDPALPAARAVQLARVRCLLVAPLENASDEPLVADAATAALASAIDGSRTRVYPIEELRGLFRGTPLELPEGVSASLALELGELLAADAVLYGSVEGRARGPEAEVTLSLRLAASGVRDTLYARTILVEPLAGETLIEASRRAALAAIAPIQERLGVPGRKVCFERQRLDRVRVLALAGDKPPPARSRVTAPLPPAPPPVGAGGAEERAVAAAPSVASRQAPAAPPVPTAPAQPVAVAPRVPAVAPRAQLTARQHAWAAKLGSRERFVLEDVTFDGRSPRFENEAGIEDLAKALAASPGARIRLEGFVDETRNERDDLRSSMELARATGRRLFELGVSRDRVTWAGRGSDEPLAPNFSARGRAKNRRVEVVVVR